MRTQCVRTTQVWAQWAKTRLTKILYHWSFVDKSKAKEEPGLKVLCSSQPRLDRYLTYIEEDNWLAVLPVTFNQLEHIWLIKKMLPHSYVHNCLPMQMVTKHQWLFIQPMHLWSSLSLLHELSFQWQLRSQCCLHPRWQQQLCEIEKQKSPALHSRG